MAEDQPNFSSTPMTDKPKKCAARKPSTRSRAASSTPSDDGINKAIKAIFAEEPGKKYQAEVQAPRERHPIARFFSRLLIAAVIIAGAIWAAWYYLPNLSSGSNQVSLNFSGPDLATLGATTTFEIVLTNNNSTAITNTILSARAPAGFVFLSSSINARNAGHNEWDLGEVAAGQTITLSIVGRVYGNADDALSWRASLNYRPANYNTDLQQAAAFNFKLKKPPFVINVTAPDTINTSSETAISFDLTNDSDWWPENLVLVPIFPAGFTLTSSSPALNKNNQWPIKFPTNTTAIVYTIRGSFAGGIPTTSVQAELRLPATIGGQNLPVAQKEVPLIILQTGTAVNLTVNGASQNLAVRPGDTLNFAITVANSEKFALTNATVNLTVDAPAIGRQSLMDWPKINDPGDADIVGVQVSDTRRQGIITWTKTQLPALGKIASGQNVAINLSLPLRTNDQADLSAFKENQITITADISYDNAGKTKTAVSVPIVITVNSDLTLTVRATDSVVNGTTKYALTWVLNNHFHALKNIKLTADVYGDITYQGADTPPAGTVNFDTTAKQLTWTIPQMPDSADVLALPFTITLNKINPTQNLLVSKVRVSAQDTVTGNTLDFTGDEVKL